jgi:hypothetical protein
MKPDIMSLSLLKGGSQHHEHCLGSHRRWMSFCGRETDQEHENESSAHKVLELNNHQKGLSINSLTDR